MCGLRVSALLSHVLYGKIEFCNAIRARNRRCGCNRHSGIIPNGPPRNAFTDRSDHTPKVIPGSPGESEKTSRSRSYAIPATIAAGLAGATYMLVQNRRAKREREEVGPRAYEVFRQWSGAYPEERYRRRARAAASCDLCRVLTPLSAVTS